MVLLLVLLLLLVLGVLLQRRSLGGRPCAVRHSPDNRDRGGAMWGYAGRYADAFSCGNVTITPRRYALQYPQHVGPLDRRRRLIQMIVEFIQTALAVGVE